MKSERRFKDLKGTDYDLFGQIWPEHGENQERLAIELHEFEKQHKINPFKVLEIGYGHGHTTIEVIKHTDAQIVAVDNEPLMKEKFIERVKRNVGDKINRVELVEADAVEYMQGLPAESFDAVYSAWTIHNFKNEQRDIFRKELYKILKPNGLFVNFDKYHPDNEKEFRQAFANDLMHFYKLDEFGREDLRKEWIDHYFEDIIPDRIQKSESEIKAMEEEGFVKVKEIWRRDLEAIVIAYKT